MNRLYISLLCLSAVCLTNSVSAIDVDIRHMDSDRMLTILGAYMNDKTALVVASGDLNGDGYDDIILGSPDAGTAKVQIVFGNSDLEGAAVIDLVDQRNAMTIADSFEGYLGRGICTGDLNGDGYDDVVIGDWFNGTVSILFGSVECCPNTVIAADQLLKYYSSSLSRFGYAVAADDFNGDGIDDLVVGAPNSRLFPYSDEIITGNNVNGSVYIVLGNTAMQDQPPQAINEIAWKIFIGEPYSEHFGFSAETGDFDNDGKNDVLIGAEGFYGGMGKSYIIFNPESIPLRTVSMIDNDSKQMLYGEYDDHFGNLLATGDMNNDGYDDILINAHTFDDLFRVNCGIQYIIEGSESLHAMDQRYVFDVPSPMVRVVGRSAGDNLGPAVIADFDGDGYNDILSGSVWANPLDRNSAGEAYIIYGSNSFFESGTIDLENDYPRVLRLYGKNKNDNMGVRVAAGDFNGDGIADALIGANGASPLKRSRAGEAYILWGGNLPEQSLHVDSQTDDAAISNAELLPNTPNPFNPRTTIPFTLAGREHVMVRVFSISGALVAELADCVYGAGRHTVQWDATGCATGIYYYQLQAGSLTITRRMLLMK